MTDLSWSVFGGFPIVCFLVSLIGIVAYSVASAYPVIKRGDFDWSIWIAKRNIQRSAVTLLILAFYFFIQKNTGTGTFEFIDCIFIGTGFDGIVKTLSSGANNED